MGEWRKVRAQSGRARVLADDQARAEGHRYSAAIVRCRVLQFPSARQPTTWSPYCVSPIAATPFVFLMLAWMWRVIHRHAWS